jgi:signal peptidase I
MFDFLLSADGKARRDAAHWLETAERVHDNRRDLLAPDQLAELQAARGDLKAAVKGKAGAAALKDGMGRLEKSLRVCGGKLYPVNSVVENVEFFLVAAIVILGLRAYFVQPFKIPTNSMWPSYYGMKAETYASDAEEPGALKKAGRFLAFGARHYSVEAPADGEVMVRVFVNEGYLGPAYAERPGRSMFIFPATMHQYEFSVAGQTASVQVPGEFASEFADVLDDTFAGEWGSFAGAVQAGAKRIQPEGSIMRVREGVKPLDVRAFWVATGKHVRKGDKILSFDIMSGDLLFVERVSYNFVAPKVGSGFVFRTENIHSDQMTDASGNQLKQYFVKRLVGTPGDQLAVRPPVLYRNGQPIDGSPAFGWNAERKGLYPGYTNTVGGLLDAGVTVTVPEHFYFAMGDNSPRSKDSRMWGYVPEKDVVGRPLFIYYPLTKRWGLAH